MQDKELKFIFYGVRGSWPVADRKVNKYGGNTSSILVEKDDKIIILDAGTGIINIGNYLKEEKPGIKKLDIFLTHFHFDHILGLPFFEPFFNEEFEINIYSEPFINKSSKDIILTIFNRPYSPISSKGIKAKINFIELDGKKRKTISFTNGIAIDYKKENSHPQCGVLIYKLAVKGKSLVYATDVETPGGFKKDILDFIKGADVMIHDSQYFDTHYNAKDNPKKGFGHSSVSMAINNAKLAKVKRLFLFHYDPVYSDKELEIMLKEARKKFKDTFLAKELKKISF